GLSFSLRKILQCHKDEIPWSFLSYRSEGVDCGDARKEPCRRNQPKRSKCKSNSKLERQVLNNSPPALNPSLGLQRLGYLRHTPCENMTLNPSCSTQAARSGGTTKGSNDPRSRPPLRPHLKESRSTSRTQCQPVLTPSQPQSG